MKYILNNQRRLQLSGSNALPGFLRSDHNTTVLFFNSGRDALYAFLFGNFKYPGTVFMPACVPEGIYTPFHKLNWKIVFYEITPEGRADLNDVRNKITRSPADIFILIHLFGIPNLDPSLISFIQSEKMLIIEDMAHAYTSESINQSFAKTGNIIMYSPSKMIGVPNAGILKFHASSPYKLATGKINILWMVYNLLSIIFLYLSSLVQKIPASLAKIILIPYKVIGEVCYRLLMINFKKRNRLASINRYFLCRTDHQFHLHKRIFIIDYYYKNLRKDLFSFFINDYQSDYVMMGFPVYINGPREEFISYLKKNDIYGLKLGSRWLFLSEDEKKNLPSAMHLYHQHFLFPVNPFHTEAELEKIVSIANRYNES